PVGKMNSRSGSDDTAVYVFAISAFSWATSRPTTGESTLPPFVRSSAPRRRRSPPQRSRRRHVTRAAAQRSDATSTVMLAIQVVKRYLEQVVRGGRAHG